MKPPSVFKKVLFGGITVGMVLLMGELSARLLFTIRDDVRRNPSEVQLRDRGFVYDSKLGWKRMPGFAGATLRTVSEFDEEGYFTIDTAQVRDSSKRKVVFIGDSNTYGFGVPMSATFAEVVERELPETVCINLGVPGYTSYQGCVVAESHLPQLKPEVVVISFNSNDRRYVVHSEDRDSVELMERIYRRRPNRILNRMVQAFESSHLFRALRSGCRKLGVAPPAAQHIPSDLRLDKMEVRVNETAYRENLTAMARIAKAQGATVVFCLLRDNPLDTSNLRLGMRYFEQEKFEAAICEFNAAVYQWNWFSSLARIYLAEAMRKRGEAILADRVVWCPMPSTLLHGGDAIRLDSSYNNIMREVAVATGSECVDAATVLEQDPSVFIDGCHFNEEGNRRVGKLLASKIASSRKR